MRFNILKKLLELEVPDYSKPKLKLEQYRTPPEIAIEIARYILSYPLVGDKEPVLVDLGSGTGMITYALALTVAGHCIGVEVDGEAINDAKKSKLWAVHPNIDFVQADALKPPLRNADYVAENPPFGTILRKIDRMFLLTALSMLPRLIATIHTCNPNLIEKLEKLAAENNYVKIFSKCFKFPIKARMEHHFKKIHYTRASLLIFVRGEDSKTNLSI